MRKHGVLIIPFSDDGPQFSASVLRCFCESVGVGKTYSILYHPQKHSIVESYMRSVKESLAALVNNYKET